MKGVSSNIFTVNNSKKSLVAEMSTIACDPNFNEMQKTRINENSQINEILVITSHKTGVNAIFDHVKTERDFAGEGEILYMVYEPSPDTLRRLPNLAGYTVTVFND
mgnify:CR=1 FL=1